MNVEMTYKEVTVIGEGGFGVVAEVQDETGASWAKKTFRPPPGLDASMIRKRFEREVKYQRQFDHPNVVKIVDDNLECDPPFFVMELAETTLSKEIQKDHTLGGAPDKALFDILAGLEEIHSVGVIHRDLKPLNVLRFSDDDEVRYAISDFGLITAAESKTTTLTNTRKGGGTPYYAAPECTTDFKRATIQIDIYSFGAILHDIFSGSSRVPYTELSATGSIGPIIEKCTKKNPVRRYKSVGELRAELYDVLNAEDLTFTSAEEEDIVRLLQNGEKLNEEESDRVFYYLSDRENDYRQQMVVFQTLTIDRIRELANDAPDFLFAIGRMYCKHVQEGVFNFDYCDVLATKVQEFFDTGSVELRAH